MTRHERVFLNVVLASWLVRGAVAWLAILPLVAAVSSTGLRQLPDGDRWLFEPGGYYLLELLRAGSAPLVASIRPYLGWLFVGWVASTLPSSLSFVWLSDVGLSFREALGRATRRWPMFLAIGLAEQLLKGLGWVAAGLLAAGVVKAGFATRSDPTQDVLKLSISLVALAPLAALSVLADAGRAQRVLDPTAPDWIRRAALACRAGFRQLASGYVLNLGCALAIVAVAARLVSGCDVAQPGPARWIAAWLIHQLAVFCLLGARAAFTTRVLGVCSSRLQALPPPPTRDAPPEEARA